MPDRLLFMLSKVQSRLSAYFKSKLKKEGIALSPGQVGILLVLERGPKTTMGQLSQTLEIDNAAITRLVDKLEKRGMVERRINPEDRRQMLIQATMEGLETAKKVKKIAQEANRKIKEGFTEQDIEIYKMVNQKIIEKF